MNKANMDLPSHRGDLGPRQVKTQTMETVTTTLDSDLEFWNVKEVAALLRVKPVSVHRLIARRALPAYRAFRRVIFKKQDVLKYLERSKSEPRKSDPYGPQG